jgi:hypothetical protein
MLRYLHILKQRKYIFWYTGNGFSRWAGICNFTPQWLDILIEADLIQEMKAESEQAFINVTILAEWSSAVTLLSNDAN